MENGASNGLSTTDKKLSSSNTAAAAAAAAAAARHTSQPFLSQCLIMGVHLDRQFEGGGDGGANEGDMSRDDVVSSCCGGGENFRTRNLQSFDIFPVAYPINPRKSPGEMAASVGFPFTSAQWRELERQAMIYKYMMYSVPVPPDLVLPLTRNFPDSSASSLFNMTTHSRNGDPEPSRCKRTDGKKWRCTKDVAAHQKYCERHLHRGRPRSRKPVEPKSSNGEKHSKRTRPVAFSLSTSHQAVVAANDQQQQQQQQQQPLLLFGCKPDAAANNGDLGLVVEAEMAHQKQQWQLMMDTNVGFASEGSSICDSTHLFEKDYMLGYSNLGAPEINPPAGFIDAWSIDNGSSSIVNDETPLSMSNGKNIPPSLDLSMTVAVGNILDDEMGKVQLNGGLQSRDGNSSKDLKWLSPVSWEPFAPGGPLAEALHPGSLYANPASSHDSISTPATTVSSPSGALQRTFFSHSDSSVCNSPTPDVPFHRLT